MSNLIILGYVWQILGWRRAFHFMEIQSEFCPYFQNGLEFWTKFGSYDPSFSRNILTFLYLKFETSPLAQIEVIHYYILFTSFLTWYEFETYIGILFDKWSWAIILSIWSRDFSQKCALVSKFCNVLLLNLLRPKVNIMVCLYVNISTKKLEIL